MLLGKLKSFSEFLVSLINEFKDGHRKKFEDNFTTIQKKKNTKSKQAIHRSSWLEEEHEEEKEQNPSEKE